MGAAQPRNSQNLSIAIRVFEDFEPGRSKISGPTFQQRHIFRARG